MTLVRCYGLRVPYTNEERTELLLLWRVLDQHLIESLIQLLQSIAPPFLDRIFGRRFPDHLALLAIVDHKGESSFRDIAPYRAHG